MSDGISLLSNAPDRTKYLREWDLAAGLTRVVLLSFDRNAARLDGAIDAQFRHGTIGSVTAQRFLGQAVFSKEQR